MREVEALLSEKQWLKMKRLLPQPKPSAKGGRPPIDNRAVVEGILWVLKTGARWRDLPPQYPSPATCWRRLRDWEEQGVWLKVWRTFIVELDETKHLEWEETFADGSFAPADGSFAPADGSFAPAKKGALASDAPRSDVPRKAREPSGWWWSMAREFLWHPLASTLGSASPAEVKLLEPTLETLPEKLLNKVQRLIVDRGYDSDPLRCRLQERGIDLICPHRRNRKKPKTQDGRKLRRYKRR